MNDPFAAATDRAGFARTVREWFAEHAPTKGSAEDFSAIQTVTARTADEYREREHAAMETTRGWQRTLHAAGLTARGWPVEYGGHGAPAWHDEVIADEQTRWGVGTKMLAIALEMARETLSSLLSTREARKITAEAVIQLVSSHFCVGEEEVTGKRRSREVALPRQVSMYMLRALTPMSTTAIGRVFKRDHSTVMHACDKIAGTMKTDIRFRKTVEELIEFAKRR